MKKTASIFLLILLAFNWVGYRLFSALVEQSSNISMNDRIEHSSYDEKSLFELKVPLNAPYFSGASNTQFESFEGELAIDGMHYRYVKRKVVNDQLVLLCLPDDSRNSIQNSRIEFFKLVNDLNHSTANGKEKHSSSSYKNVLSVFTEENNFYSVPALSFAKLINGDHHDPFPEMLYANILIPPPKV